MKKITISLLILFVIYSCSSVKSTQKAINSGNYDSAIKTAVENLRKNKTRKGNQPYISMLEEAFKKATERDEARIDYLKNDGNTENIESVYNLYVKLSERQELIKPLLPLRNTTNGVEANFNFKNYTNDIIASKRKLTEFLYAKAKNSFNTSNKLDFRRIYEDLTYIDRINPNYKDTRNLIRQAHERGTDYVLVSMKNKTRKIIPKRLAKDLLAFDTYGFDDLWTVYHSTPDEAINYDFGLELTLKNIKISPERIREREMIKEREIVVGWEYKVDKNGKEVLDIKGNKIKVDKLKNVHCKLLKVTQLKSAEVQGQVRYVDFNSKQLVKSFPVSSGFIFEHVYANYQGDKRALTGKYKDMIKRRRVSFPSNEQMVFDAGEDLKKNLKRMILRNRFR
jgi:hypothetical protein